MQQNCHSDNFLDQLRAFPPPFGQSPSGLPITQDFCLEKLTRNNEPFLDTMNVMLVSYAPLGFPFIEMLRKYLAHFLDSHSFDWNVTVSLTFSIFSTD